MRNPLIRESIGFTNTRGEKELHCTMHICQDDSVYVEGDEIEIIFEESDNSVDEAIRYLSAHGYKKRSL